MTRNKAIFDADILINMVNTGSIDDILKYFDIVYVSDYVCELFVSIDTVTKHKLKLSE